MKRLMIIFLCILGIAAGIYFFLKFLNPGGKLFDLQISGVQIVDVEKGEIKNCTVGILHGRIDTICPGTFILNAKRSVDGTDHYIIPALWDMHTHYSFSGVSFNPLLLANGVLGIRDMAGNLELIKAIKDSIRRGLIRGPEIITSGPIVDGIPPYWNFSDTISIPANANSLIEKQLAHGADFIKIYDGLSKDVYYALSSAAKAHGVDLVGHLPDRVSIYEAIDAGQKSIEHMEGIVDVLDSLIRFQASDSVDSFIADHRTAIDLLGKKLAASDTWLCPTLVVLQALSHVEQSSQLAPDSLMSYLPLVLGNYWMESAIALKVSSSYARSRQLFRLNKRILPILAKHKVKLLAGTDFPNPYCYPGYSLHTELELLVSCGLSTREALYSATIAPAIFLKLDKDFGELKRGKVASFVILDKNPLSNIENTRSVKGVVLRGEYLDKKDLDSLMMRIRCRK